MRFGRLQIEYDERVLTPRPWTARQALWGAELLHLTPGPTLELCCGAGQIGLLAVASSKVPLVSVDLDPAACELTRRNADAAGLGDRVEVRLGDVVCAVAPDEEFSLVLADPPYLRTTEVARYPEDPRSAIDGGPDGMALVWPCVDTVCGHLASGGNALLQLRSAGQAMRVADRLAESGDVALTEQRSLGRGVVARLQRP
jgi:release factor glutamine methyltransferase